MVKTMSQKVELVFLPVKLVFHDLVANMWNVDKKAYESVYNHDKYVKLSLASCLHSGSTINAVLQIDNDQIADIKEALRMNALPVFYIYSIDEGDGI